MNIKSIGYTALIAGSLFVGACQSSSRQANYSADKCKIIVLDSFINSQDIKSSKYAHFEDAAIAQVLRDGWAKVLDAEAQYMKRQKKPIYKADPNINVRFFNKLVKFSREINTNPFDLSVIMYKESHYDPQIMSGDKKYVGLIQMDETSFNSTVVKMLEYEQYCAEHPKQKISLKRYIAGVNGDKIQKAIRKDKITYNTYKTLSRERQFEYAKRFLQYHILMNGLDGKEISGKQVWALIHRPNFFDDPNELSERQIKINNTRKILQQFAPEEYKNLLAMCSSKKELKYQYALSRFNFLFKTIR